MSEFGGGAKSAYYIIPCHRVLEMACMAWWGALERSRNTAVYHETGPSGTWALMDAGKNHAAATATG